ncbi:2-phosphosulfolactate phosphatase [candidate division KSB3 bacterium]|uniref:Probable 2-phosphosulfolactate phosphatase n=1 Tax=candidate division KSB3 bacterium TaxID=2044937 RepID=A0A2G6KF88_9BACT|nr:MAG: 2-phosphosulfolactate phosphatase [candidate division KSB3 bacterium]
MKIRILQLLDGAREAKGLTVIIDVFRAFSTACYVFKNGASRIIPVGDIKLAYQLKAEHPSFPLIGERHGERPPGFDYGNSPAEIEHVDFAGKTIIHTTSAGTQGIANANKAQEIITGSFCNAGAVIRYIRSQQPGQVSLVCMGTGGKVPTDEDTLCAQYIKDALEEKSTHFTNIRKHLRTYESGQRFFDPAITWAHERDFDLCLTLDNFDAVLQVQRRNNSYPVLHLVK